MQVACKERACSGLWGSALAERENWVYGSDWSVRTTHAKISRGTDEHLRLMEDVSPLYGTKNKSDEEVGGLRGIQKLSFNKTLELLDPAIPEARLPLSHLAHFESPLFFLPPFYQKTQQRYGYSQEMFGGFC